MSIDNKPELYKEYVILHEFLHAFPFYIGHDENNCINDNYSVMFQQTRIADCKNKNKKQTKKCNKSIISLPNEMKNHQVLDSNRPDMDVIKKRFDNFNQQMILKQNILKKIQMIIP